MLTITSIPGSKQISGVHHVALEFVNGRCYNEQCREHRLFLLSGFVLVPKESLGWGKKDWQSDRWRRDELFPLELFEDDLGRQVADHIKLVRKTAPELAIVAKRHSKTTGSDYWANVCPCCKRLQGTHFLMAKRSRLAADRSARSSNKLIYRGLRVTIAGKAYSEQELATRAHIDHLFNGYG